MSSSAAAMFGEDPHDGRGGRGNALCFPAAFYGKSFLEMDAVKGGKSDAFEGKRRKGELLSKRVLFLFWFFDPTGLWKVGPTVSGCLKRTNLNCKMF
ncbi:unnamed protein product [Tetraodon nigroviridis]|uniref:(spotted green pufferfish) hypothetical protein n=1 Tax=Tetraodon nigroviridis TaxID=99883 RepID=Q4RN87_TETNG|nr:unnamed protein product [Tetraodon nigroviridis]